MKVDNTLCKAMAGENVNWLKKKKKVYDLSVRRKGFCCCMPVDQIWKMEGTLEILTHDQPQDLQW